MTAHIIMMFLWIISLVTSSASSEFRLSDSKLLLPYNSYSPLNYTLRGSDGTCYEWSSGTPEVATVSPLTSPLENCSTEAVVTAVWPSSIRTITTIYARVLETGHVVECDVIVDNIRRIEVETTTQELYLHNTPESLVVVGYDEYGNTFSSLHGVPFKWSLHEDSQVDMSHGHSVLRFLSWSESEYATPPSIQNLESRGLQGHMQLVSGLRTGSALVSASLQEPVYSNVPAARVRLLVMANARLSPALAYLIPSSRLKLQVRVLQQGGDKVIHLPSPQYHLHVNDTTLVDLDEDDGCTITAKQYGQTEIKLLDRNVEEALANQSTLVHPDESTEELSRPPHRRFPVSIIHVVEPAYLRFSLQASDEHSDRCLKAVSSITRAHSESAQNHHKWVLEFGRKYTIHIDLYDHNNHRLYPSDDIRLNVIVSGEKLQLIKSTINFTWFVVQPVALGIASIEARTIGLADKSGSLIGTTYAVTGMQEATIYSPIDIQPSFLLLPWSIGTELNASFQLVATGGDGVYTWLALDPEGLRKQTKPVVITPNGEVSALTPGDASIVASSTSNPQLCGFAKVSVTFPASIKFVPGPAEVVIFPVGSHDRTIHPLVVAGINRSVLTVGLAVLDSHGHSMSDCRGLNITIKPLDISVVKILPGHLFVQSESSHSDLSACLQVHVVGITVGFTELEAVYHLHSLVSGMSVEETDAKVTLSARFPVAVHQAIDFLNPSSSVAYAALGSTRTFLVNHGPQPWPVNPSGHFARIKPVDPPHPVGPLVPLIKRVPQPLNTYVDAYGVVYDDSNLPTAPRLLVFSIQCQSVGAFRFYLEIGNEPSPTNMLPLVMDKEFTLTCQVPSRLHLSLHPALPVPLSSSHACPLLNATVTHPLHQISVPNSAPLLITLSFFGPNGDKLEAVDSMRSTVLVLDRSFSSEDERPVYSSLVADSTPRVFLPDGFPSVSSNHNSHVQTIYPYFYIVPSILAQSTGSVYIHVESELSFSHPTLTEVDSVGRISSALSVFFSPPASIFPDTHLQLFHLRQAELHFSVLGGSGVFDISLLDNSNCSTGGLIDITPATSGSALVQSPRDYIIRSRRVGRSCFRVTDVCFPALQSDPTVATGSYRPLEIDVAVDVIGLHALRLQVANHIELGAQTTAFVEPLDTNGNLMPTNFTLLLELRIHQRPVSVSKTNRAAPLVLNIPEVLGPSIGFRQADSSQEAGIIRFAVGGASLGSVYLTASTEVALSDSSNPFLIQSNSVEIQVFSPVRLSPCNFNLLLGAEYELHVSGGPRSSSMEYSIHPVEASKANLLIERVTAKGVLVRAAGASGLVNVYVRALSHIASVNSSVLLTESFDPSVASEANCVVNLVTISAIRIGCPLASASDLPSNSFSFNGAADREPNDDVRFLISCDSEPQSSICGTAPLWVHGIASTSQPNNTSDIISPLAMAGVQPPMRFKWRLHPPQASSFARLSHYLTGFNVEVDETATASGMVLVGISPGRVTILLTVETDQPAPQLVGESGKPTRQLLAQLTVSILPPLRLHAPSLHLPRQLIMSPGAQYQLQPRNSILASSQVQYRLGGLVTWHGVQTRSVSKELVRPVTVTSTGLIHSLPSSDSSATERRYSIEILSSPTEYAVDINSSSMMQSSVIQLLSIEVIVKRPRFLLVTPFSDDYIRASGLPVGGPYLMGVSYHDELGRPFDAVAADDYLRLKFHLHRTDFVEVQSIYTFGSSDLIHSNLGRQHHSSLLYFMVLPLTSRDGSSGGIRPHALLRLLPLEHPTDFAPTYLSVIHGGELDILPSSLLTVAQWIRLPSSEGVWSSSNPNVLWVDNNERLALARHDGPVHLTYSLGGGIVANESNDVSDINSRPTYTLSVTIIPLTPICSDGRSTELVYVTLDEKGASTAVHGSIILPVVSSVSGDCSTPTTLQFNVKFCAPHRLAPDVNRNSDQFSTLSERAKQILSSAAPLHCAIRLITTTPTTELATHSRIVPNWLSVLLLWNQTASLESEESATLYSLNDLLSADLEPIAPYSPFSSDTVQWQCVIRTSPTWHRLAPMFGLILEPGSRLQLQLRTSKSPSTGPDVLAEAHITPLPGFQLVVPPPVAQDVNNSSAQLPVQSCPLRLHTPNELTRRILVFIPPNTIAAMNSKEMGSVRLLARSKSPRLLDVSSVPRPVASLAEVTQILSEHIQTSPSHTEDTGICSLNAWNTLVKKQIQQIDNDAAISSADSTVKRNLLWVLEVKASLGPQAVETVVEVVISLRLTGQHVTVPVHIRLPSRGELFRSARDIGPDTFGFTWFHLITLIIITLLVAFIVHFMFRSATFVSSSSGSAVIKNLPPAFSPIGLSRSSPNQLWTQTGHTAPRSFTLTPSNSRSQIMNGSSANRSASRFTPNSVGGEGDLTTEERKWRRALSGGSPSRLRDTFDSI